MHFSIPSLAVCLASVGLVSSALHPKQHLHKRQSVDATTLPWWSQRNLKTIERIYNLTVYPNNVPIVEQGASAVPAGLFDSNATGRISPLGNFTGFTDSIEYFFGLAPTPQNSAGQGFYSAEVVSYTSGCPGIASSVVYFHTGTFTSNGTLDETKPRTILSQIAFWRFDPQGAVLQYEAWIPELAMWVKTATGVDTTNPAIQAAVESALCVQVQDHCKGANQQYNSSATCVATMATKPFGSFDEVWGDNIVCREVHVLLTHVRPQIHCPHVGPFGGSPPNNYKCVNPNYTKEYFDDQYLFGNPDAFSCDLSGWMVEPPNGTTGGNATYGNATYGGHAAMGYGSRFA